MAQIYRKGGKRSAVGWRFNRAVMAWCCDQHGSPRCTVCPRPKLEDERDGEWLIDREGIAMPEPKQMDLLPSPTVILSSLTHPDGLNPWSVELGVDMVSREVADITDDVVRFCDGQGDGLVNVFLAHATAGLAIIELGHGTEHDTIALLDRLAPQEQSYASDCGDGDEGSDHLMPLLLNASLTVPVIAGRPALGGSQSVVLIDRFFGMDRRVRLSFAPAQSTRGTAR